MSEDAVVDRLYREFQALDALLVAQNEVSLVVVAAEQSRKYLLLSAASYFEHRITDIVSRWVNITSAHNPHILKYLLNTGVSRCYHKWFDWKRRDGRAFDGMLGSPLRDFLIIYFKDNKGAAEALHDFLEIGESRNQLVHQNFGHYHLESTIQDIYKQYTSASRFPTFLELALQLYTESPKSPD